MGFIDVHIHVGHRFEWSEDAKKLWMDTGPYYTRIFHEDGRQNPLEYLKPLKEEGVLCGILIPEYSPLTAGVMPVERAVQLSKLFPEFPFLANLNPNFHRNLGDELERQISLGAVGLKIHSVHGFFMPNDLRLYPVYEVCRERGLPVFFHAGSSVFPGSRLRYADPYAFDDIANDFPGMTMVLCHGGRGFWYHIAEFMVKRFEHVFIDISGLPPKNLLRYYPSMKKIPEKFLFGTDYPGVPGIKKNISELEKVLSDDRAFELISWKNAYELFGFWREGVFFELEWGGVRSEGNSVVYSYRREMEPLSAVVVSASEAVKILFSKDAKATERLLDFSKRLVKELEKL